MCTIFKAGDVVKVSGRLGTVLNETSEGLLVLFNDIAYESGFYPPCFVKLIKSGDSKYPFNKKHFIWGAVASQN